MNVQLDELRPVPSEAEREAAQRQLELRQQRQLAMSDTRRALVLDAARSVFAEKGLEGAGIREIARRAGYTPGALYSYFDSKEAIYAALLSESLDRLHAEVAAARAPKGQPQRLLAERANAWFGFYSCNPRDLDLGFYLVQGLAPRGLNPWMPCGPANRRWKTWACHPTWRCRKTPRCLPTGWACCCCSTPDESVCSGSRRRICSSSTWIG
jgi:AcrR family transcriptional regulator